MLAVGALHLKRTDVDATSSTTRIKLWAALVVERRRSEVRVACVNRRAAGQRRMREGRAAVVLQRSEHRGVVDLITNPGQKAAAVVAAEVVTRSEVTIFPNSLAIFAGELARFRMVSPISRVASPPL